MPPAMNDNRPAEGAGAKGRCPLCGKPRDPRFRPFCSPRCADADLQCWFSGRYVLPAAEEEGPGEEDRAAEG
jgi:endogenous inhibitor of DNA gyrase (YacG/DUF329 family)